MVSGFFTRLHMAQENPPHNFTRQVEHLKADRWRGYAAIVAEAMRGPAVWAVAILPEYRVLLFSRGEVAVRTKPGHGRHFLL
jgi:hypothetical protein